MFTNHNYNDFFETAASIGFLPQITLPTRNGEAGYRSSLIDNIFTNAIDAIELTISGTLLTDITDRKAIFTSVNDVQYKERIPKYKKIKVRDNLSMTNFINELQQMNIYNSLDANPQSNPNDNYEIFERLLVQAREKHLPIKNVKYCKNKHNLNKWMTHFLRKLNVFFWSMSHQKDRNALFDIIS